MAAEVLQKQPSEYRTATVRLQRRPPGNESERHYLLGGASRRLGASLNHLPDWPTGEHGPGPGGPRVVRFIAMFEGF